jgi:GTP-binding protein
MLVDSIKVEVRGGKGGAGCVSFRREKFIPRGGPDGGNGGWGGSVYVIGENNPYLLKKFRECPLIKAEPGKPGGTNKKYGANAPDTIIKVPFGTRITRLVDGAVLEILDKKKKYLLAKGAIGGRGNYEFKSATNQTPRFAEPGRIGEILNYQFDLMLIADVGLIGLPNAGKSTLLNALTDADAKVAPYPFTTLEPNLGPLGDYIIADIPGLIEGASTGKGLGFQFLRHVERTRLLVHCLSVENPDPQKTYQGIRKELDSYSEKLSALPELVIFTKIDLLEEKELKKFQTKFKKLFPKSLFLTVLVDEQIATLRQTLLSLLKPKPSSTHSRPQ